MAEGPLDNLTSAIDGVLENSLGQLREQIGSALAANGGQLIEAIRAESTQAAEESAKTARQESELSTAQSLAQASRRIRSESSVGGIAAALVDAASAYAGCVGLFVKKGDRLTGFRARGLSQNQSDDAFQRIDFSASNTTGFAHAAESKDQVICGVSSNELSADVVSAFALAEDERVTLYPLVLRDNVSAILLASAKGREAGLNNAAIELLTSISEAWIEAVGTRKTAQLKQRSA